MKRKKCQKPDCNNPVWSGGLCKNHIARKPIKQTSVKKQRWNVFKTDNNGKKTMAKASLRSLRYNLFMVLWKQRGPKSEVSGEKIFGEPSSAHFHHILPKEKYPELDLVPENIIIMTMDEHNNVENDMYKYEEVNRRRVELLKKYDLI